SFGAFGFGISLGSWVFRHSFFNGTPRKVYLMPKGLN
ncbi:MAG: hypothetical protein ACI9OU_000630, partial [Candidatus Promineifilaceae bacterium]